MRRRLIGSTLAIAFVSVIMLGVPLMLLARHQVWTSQRDRIREQAASIATGLEDRLDVGQPINISRYPALMPGRRIVLKMAHGPILVAGPVITGRVIEASVSVADSTITVQAPRGPTVTRAREVTLLVLGLAVLAVVAAVGLARWQARRLARPLADLVARADALGRGHFAVTPVHSGVPEIDGISRVLERSAHQIGTLVALQRDFASDAAHQLRTPLTGIGLRLEELSRIGDTDVRAEADDALTQVERLDRVITSLLARARGDSEDPTAVDLAQLVEQESAAWRRVLKQSRRSLALDVEHGLLVLARHEHLVSILTSLLENADTHGAGQVSVSVHRVGQRVELRVRDGGAGVAPEFAAHIFDRQVSGNHGTGIGLALARSLAAAEDGTLVLSTDNPAEFILTLPLIDQSRQDGSAHHDG